LAACAAAPPTVAACGTEKMQIDRLLPLARQLLVLPMGEARRDLWLWEHSERVMKLTQLVAVLPEVQGREADLTALAAAALFHDAGWVLDLHHGRCERWQLLTRPTNDIQRELGAAMLQEEAGTLLAPSTARIAADAIRACNDRRTGLLEARILAESEALDEIGTLYVLRQFRQYQAEGRPLQQLVDSWRRQKEYRYWEVRLNDGFRYESTRRLARQRLVAVEAFLTALESDLHGEDLVAACRPAPDGARP
jgi:HD superfamily phosphodiesterase